MPRGINTNVKFCWLPSHVNLTGNEQADKLANMAAKLPMVDKDTELDFNEGYTLVERYIDDKLLTEGSKLKQALTTKKLHQ